MSWDPHARFLFAAGTARDRRLLGQGQIGEPSLQLSSTDVALGNLADQRVLQPLVAAGIATPTGRPARAAEDIDGPVERQDPAESTTDGTVRLVNRSSAREGGADGSPSTVKAPATKLGSKGAVDYGHDYTLGSYGSEVYVKGRALGRMHEIDDFVADFMRRAGIPNVSMGIVAGDGRLVLARGYTHPAVLPDRSERFNATPSSVYRMMSVSKQFTATAILALAEAGALGLNDTLGTIFGTSLADLIALYPPPTDAASVAEVANRLAIVESATIHEILTHTSVLGQPENPASTADPGIRPYQNDRTIGRWVGRALPVSIDDIIAWTTVNIAWDPSLVGGYRYANFGYLVLGRVIEFVSGMTYSAYVRKHVLNPLDLGTFRQALPRIEDRWPDETRYYYDVHSATPSIERYTREEVGDNDASFNLSVLDESGDALEIPYGGRFNAANFDAFGGWVGSVVDLCRYAKHMHPAKVSVIAPASLALAESHWVSTGATQWYGYGRRVDRITPGGGDARFHQGDKEGSRGLLYQFPDLPALTRNSQEASFAVLMNRGPEENTVQVDPTTGASYWQALREALEDYNGLVDQMIANSGGVDLFDVYAPTIAVASRVSKDFASTESPDWF